MLVFAGEVVCQGDIGVEVVPLFAFSFQCFSVDTSCWRIIYKRGHRSICPALPSRRTGQLRRAQQRSGAVCTKYLPRPLATTGVLEAFRSGSSKALVLCVPSVNADTCLPLHGGKAKQYTSRHVRLKHMCLSLHESNEAEGRAKFQRGLEKRV